MSGLKERMKRRPVAWFFGLSMAIAVAVIPLFLIIGADAKISAALEESGIPRRTDFVTIFRLAIAEPQAIPGLALSVAQPFSPDLAAFAVAAVAFGTVGVRRILLGYRFWSGEVGRRRGLKAWGAMVLVFVSMSFATAGLHALFMPEGTWGWDPGEIFSWGLPLMLLVALFLDVGAVSEETGWRGFALPILQDRMTPLAASLVLGAMWAVWHFPVKFDNLFYGLQGALALYGLLVVRFVFLSIVVTYFYNRTGGSTLIAVAMHGLHNDAVGFMGSITGQGLRPYLISEIDLLVPIVAVAVSLFFLSGRRLGLTKGSKDERAQGAVRPNEAAVGSTPS